jgi:hypothetical protein
MILVQFFWKISLFEKYWKKGDEETEMDEEIIFASLDPVPLELEGVFCLFYVSTDVNSKFSCLFPLALCFF